MITCLQDLLTHIVKLQQKHPEIKNNKYSSVNGIFWQFQALNLPQDDRNHEEVMIVYFEENVEKTSDQDEDLIAKTIWLDKKTQMVIDAPQWFLERKERMKKLQDEIHKEYDPVAKNKKDLKWMN